MGITANICCTQTQNLEWLNILQLPDRSDRRQIKKTADDNLIIVGTIWRTNSQGQQLADIAVTKLNQFGDTIWTKFIDLPTSAELATDFEIQNNGNLLIAGLKRTNMSSLAQGLLMSVDSSGNFLWENTYGDPDLFWEFRSIKLTPNAILLAGVQTDLDADTDALVVKNDLNGNMIWSQTVGGSEYEDAWDIEMHPSGGYVFTGGTYSFAQGAEDDAWIVKLHEDGEFAWRKTYGTPDMVDWAWRFVPTINEFGTIDGYVFTGLKESGTVGDPNETFGNVYLIKVDTAGTVVWDKSIMLPSGQFRREGTDITRTTDGGFAICGWGFFNISGTFNLNFAIHFIKTDSEGAITHEILFDPIGNDYITRSIIEYAPNNFYVTGIKLDVNFNDSIFVAKVNLDEPNTITRGHDSKMNFEIFPNPTNDYITILNTGQSKTKEVQIYSLYGKLLKSSPLMGAQKTTISLAEFKNQQLIIKIKDDQGAITISKITTF